MVDGLLLLAPYNRLSSKAGMSLVGLGSGVVRRLGKTRLVGIPIGHLVVVLVTEIPVEQMERQCGISLVLTYTNPFPVMGLALSR